MLPAGLEPTVFESEGEHLYDIKDGCQYFDSCFACPLLDCYESYNDEVGGGVGPITAAVSHAWERGVRHPAFLKMYTSARGSVAEVPDDVFEPLRGGLNPGHTYLISDDEVELAQSLVSDGWSWSIAGRAARRSPAGLMYRIKRGAA